MSPAARGDPEDRAVPADQVGPAARGVPADRAAPRDREVPAVTSLSE